MHSLISSASTFALLTCKPLPELTTMMFYFNFGSISVTIQPGRCLVLEKPTESIELLRSFHKMLFRDLLQTTKPFLVDDRSDKDNSFYIVPVLDGLNIDWHTVGEFQRLVPSREVIDEATRGRMHFQSEDYLHKVVTPWYRNDKESRFVVLKVHTDMTPLSPFPLPQYQNFAQYMFERYKLRTVNPNQFMLEVRGITQKLNRLSPGQCVDGSKKSAFRDREFLVPELCHNYGFPANLWLKATLLPSVLHRMHYLLHAEALRVSINRFMGNTLGLQCKPKPLLENWWYPKTVANVPVITDCQSNSIEAKRKNESSASSNDHTSYVFDSSIDDPWADIVDTFEYLEVHEPSSSDHILDIDTLSCPWADYEEPQDLNRNLENVFEVDVRYFQHFVDDYKSTINMDKIANYNPSILVPECVPSNLPAEEQRINLLLIKPTTPSEGPEQRDILAALTCASSADVFNGERLEVLGDSFLKFGASVFLVKQHPEWHEGFLTTCKGRMVSNRNLLYLGQHLVGGKLKVFPFDPKSSWMPPLMCVPKELKVSSILR